MFDQFTQRLLLHFRLPTRSTARPTRPAKCIGSDAAACGEGSKGRALGRPLGEYAKELPSTAIQHLHREEIHRLNIQPHHHSTTHSPKNLPAPQRPGKVHPKGLLLLSVGYAAQIIRPMTENTKHKKQLASAWPRQVTQTGFAITQQTNLTKSQPNIINGHT
ncbi:hypothetical protein [Ideonella sp.]|uniref:hypothetical protein n=1 Tax=Ideonella sp. TaxID=1929293 RepID=UPI003BB676EC